MLDFRKYENVPRFQLDRRPGRSRLKLTCPACGKSRCLTPYIDVATGQVVGNESEDAIMNGLAVTINDLPVRM